MSSQLVNHAVVNHSGVFVLEREAPVAEEQLALQEKSAAEALTVIDSITREEATGKLVRLKRLIAYFHEKLDPVCRKTDEAHREATKRRGEMIDPLEIAYKSLGGKVARYDLEVRQQEERAQRQAEEAARLEAAQMREEEIVQAETAGASREEVIALCEMPLPIAPRVMSRAIQQGPVSTRDNYKGRVTNLMALVQHVAKHPEHLGLVAANESAVNQLARALKTAMNIPGIEVVNEAGIATRFAQRGSR